jgi:citrate lyase subunit beta/citryl-CoA lyase
MRRSWLLVPASRPDEVGRAARSGADAIVLDLVELVTERDRDAARRAFPAMLAMAQAGGAGIFAQTDPQSAAADLAACAGPGLTGVVISRTESPVQIQDVARRLDDLEKDRGLAAGSLQIVAALETAPGNHAAFDIARADPRVKAVTLGRADLVMDLRPEPSGEIHLMPYLMQRLILVARAAGVVPLGAWWRAPDRGLLASPEGTYRAAQRGRAIGFRGTLCLHPRQVEPLNRAYA